MGLNGAIFIIIIKEFWIWNFLIGKVYIIHAHDCEINFGCWLQESKCAFLDDDDENGSVQSQNLEMSWTILAVIQLIPIELEMTFEYDTCLLKNCNKFAEVIVPIRLRAQFTYWFLLGAIFIIIIKECTLALLEPTTKINFTIMGVNNVNFSNQEISKVLVLNVS